MKLKRISCILLIFIICFPLLGCWNYISLSEIDIVTGLALDLDEDTKEYKVTYEIIDNKNLSDDAMKTTYISSSAPTIFDAVRKTKRLLSNKLYGGNMESVIISKKIAKTGIMDLLENFLRDGEPRETLTIIVSQEETAEELLKANAVDSNVISYEINDAIEEDAKVTASTVYTPLYIAYTAIKEEGNTLLLPAISLKHYDGDDFCELNGIAVFKEDKLTGFLSPEDSKWLLFIKNLIKGGVLTFNYGEENDFITVQIRDSDTKHHTSINNDTLVLSLNVSTNINTVEINSKTDLVKIDTRKDLEQSVSDYIKNSIIKFYNKIKSDFGYDIFGLGNNLRKFNKSSWDKSKENWDDLFLNSCLNIDCNVTILNSGVLKNY